MIVFKIEEYDTVRRIAMTLGKPRERGEPRLGTSTGRWDGETLVVETTDIAYRHFNSTAFRSPATGASRSGSAERRRQPPRLHDDGYGPATFTAPVTLRKQWEWRPGEQVRPYNCR